MYPRIQNTQVFYLINFYASLKQFFKSRPIKENWNKELGLLLNIVYKKLCKNTEIKFKVRILDIKQYEKGLNALRS